MPTYNKLVRDKIPDIIKKSGKIFTSKKLSNDEYIEALYKKLYEEIEELTKANSQSEVVEEAADVLELLYALMKVNGTSIEELENVRAEKKKHRGGFENRVFLQEVSE
ncbi:nucleoside triphosphate pyrophosphohydrolase [Salirhabdus salicampi]|uniref:nucleoside triphosphate pyrophosphohydrolase n=1 Tax=Salirhabdus salicampi TaxID=476102 RepID=UPI0020C5AF2F|nr:nucleoside triphosphate pyrophosphohydrolase [Salirhabdus salicampi]MCP8615244.1 nucleoside triphosphate pyrophosphohydrolase [Salirhabdus salicampi]